MERAINSQYQECFHKYFDYKFIKYQIISIHSFIFHISKFDFFVVFYLFLMICYNSYELKIDLDA